jgi:hypothetical protein
MKWDEVHASGTVRDRDLRLLERLLAMDLSTADEEILKSMKRQLDSQRSRALSERQREVARAIADRKGDVGEYENLVSSGKVPNKSTKVFDFETMKRPMVPPGRKKA